MQRRYWIYLFVGLAIAIGILCGVSDYLGTPRECKQYKGDERAACKLVDRLHNDDLIWSHTFVGLMYEIKWTASAAWDAYGTPKDINPFLLKALKDPNRFAIAHVLLVDRIGIGCTDENSEFCGLIVRIDGGNGVSYEGEKKLYDFWETQLSQK